MKRKGLGDGGGSGFFNILGNDPQIHSDSAKGIKQARGMNGFMGGQPPKPNSYNKEAKNYALDMLNDGKSTDEVMRELMDEFGLTELEAENIIQNAEDSIERMGGPMDDDYDPMTVDTDGDGMSDADDCDPLDPEKQDDDGDGFSDIGDFFNKAKRDAPTSADAPVTEVDEITSNLPDKPSRFSTIRRAGKVAFGKVSELVTDYKEDRDMFKQKLHDMSDSQLKEAAVRYSGSGSGLFGGTNNPFTSEAVRRVNETKKFDESVKKAQIGEDSDEAFSLKEFF